MECEWKLTDEEVAECLQSGCSVAVLQEAKKKAYAANGGVILNPDALEDMYEALEGLMDLQGINDGRVTVRSCPSTESILKAQKALMKAEGK